MLSHGLLSLLALSAVSTASPISLVRRSSLIPKPPPACLGKISNSTAVSNTTVVDPSIISNVTAGAFNNITDPTSISNITSGVNITSTTTCLIPASQIATLMNSTDLSNMTAIYNCTDPTVSNSTDLSPFSNITDTSDLTPPDNSTVADPTKDVIDDTTNDTPDDTIDDTTDDTIDDNVDDAIDDKVDDTIDDKVDDTIDDKVDDTIDDTLNPPSDATPPDTETDDNGSSGIIDPTSGQFTADTTDPEGRRRSLSPKWLPAWMRRTSHTRRIAQADLPDIAMKWQILCLVSGGDIFTDQPCVELAGLGGIDALLSTGGVCDQQDIADKMIDFAKSKGIKNKKALVAAAIAYRQHARNADDMGDGIVPSTPYCTKAPRNPELEGIVNKQLPGVEPGLYGGPNEPIVAFGEDGTCPAGLTPDVSTCSCI